MEKQLLYKNVGLQGIPGSGARFTKVKTLLFPLKYANFSSRFSAQLILFAGSGPTFLAPLSPPESIFDDFNRSREEEFDDDEAFSQDFGGKRKKKSHAKVFEEKKVQDFPHDGGYTAKQEIFVVMKNTDREGSSRPVFGINNVDDQVINRATYEFIFNTKKIILRYP